VPSLLFFFLCALCTTSNAETLQGKIIGSDNQPKQFASVSIFGVENRRTQTNETGEFSVNLPPGSYVIRIWQQPNRQEFDFQITSGSQEPQTFKVGW
jgi:hypothetical protein